jgi:hypothetical protein
MLLPLLLTGSFVKAKRHTGTPFTISASRRDEGVPTGVLATPGVAPARADPRAVRGNVPVTARAALLVA